MRKHNDDRDPGDEDDGDRDHKLIIELPGITERQLAAAVSVRERLARARGRR